MQIISGMRQYPITPWNNSKLSPSAIDNATRSLIGMGQLPVTCGLYFSLGHSTIVIIVVSISLIVSLLANVTRRSQSPFLMASINISVARTTSVA